jgi:hypothetical protein
MKGHHQFDWKHWRKRMQMQLAISHGSYVALVIAPEDSY